MKNKMIFRLLRFCEGRSPPNFNVVYALKQKQYKNNIRTLKSKKLVVLKLPRFITHNDFKINYKKNVVEYFNDLQKLLFTKPTSFPLKQLAKPGLEYRNRKYIFKQPLIPL